MFLTKYLAMEKGYKGDVITMHNTPLYQHLYSLIYSSIYCGIGEYVL
jgi:hypothetical protein